MTETRAYTRACAFADHALDGEIGQRTGPGVHRGFGHRDFSNSASTPSAILTRSSGTSIASIC